MLRMPLAFKTSVLALTLLTAPLLTQTETRAGADEAWQPIFVGDDAIATGAPGVYIEGADRVVSFPEGTARLDRSERLALARVARAVGVNSAVGQTPTHVVVAGFADADLRDALGRSLDGKSQSLAERRIDAVREVLADVGLHENVVEVNLARTTGLFEELFATRSARVKIKALHGYDSDDSTLNAAGRIVSSKGGTGRVVVVLSRL